ncbi:helix-turn-helix domain-containing protein [Pseudomonas sp. PB120]|uniref:helix-turn-helix transcriptional regulator n=1 Tax=Pseudomonas sp. PB120 TaxID=2494700 RepID=UPI0012FE667C|nr:helix-turn-helix domain-containing protein [Pseudomonas sp. PB120]MVV52271.1 helix-turn-helix domain-containing protein [Pseudomonas sp. PB120]
MAKRTYSPYTLKALEVLGKMIQLKRKETGLTLQELADRAGVSRGLIQRLEKCEPVCEIGVAFEVAHLLGIELFESPMGQNTLISSLTDKIALLPASVRDSKKEVSNAF